MDNEMFVKTLKTKPFVVKLSDSDETIKALDRLTEAVESQARSQIQLTETIEFIGNEIISLLRKSNHD